MNKMIKRGIAGVGALGAAGGVLFGALPSDAATTTVAASKLGTLHASQIKYVTHHWACDTDGGLDGRACEVSAQIPKGWAWTPLDRYEARFDKSKTWMLRIDGYIEDPGTPAEWAQNKKRALRGTPGLRILSVKNGSLPSLVNKRLPRVVFTTVTYTYRDSKRGTRWVASRYVDQVWGGDSAREEITVAGRPQDAGALGVVLNRATQTIQQAD
jgi:hypothetical protein